MRRRVAIIGTGMVRTGRSKVPSWELFAEAVAQAIDEAWLDPSEIQALHIGNVMSDLTERQTNISPKVLSSLGLGNNIPCIRYETACCSGSVSFRQAYLNILTGMYDVQLVGGAERLRSVDGSLIQQGMTTAMDATERAAGLTFAAYFAFVAKAYARRYGISPTTLEEKLAEISVKNHFHGSFNELAQLQTQVTVDDVLNSVPVAPPIKLLDCCPFSDGAAALVLASEDYAKSCANPIWIEGSGQASGHFLVSENDDLGSNPAIAKASKQAYEQAKLGPADVDICEVHDCVNIHEVLCLEGAGLFERGTAIFAAADRRTYFDGDMPTNLSGGLKARGHPLGATGAYQLCEVARELRGDFGGKLPAKAPEVGLTVNVGGTGTNVTVHILRKN